MQGFARNKLVIFGIAILIAGGVWYGLSASSPATPTLITTSVAGAGGGADQGVVATLLTLRAVKLDGTIFSDPSFLNLKDFSTQIVPEPIGRENPFAPLSSQAAASASTTKGAQLFKPRP